MRRRIDKHNIGRSTQGRKEVALRINKSGLSAKGEQRYSIAARFAGGSHVKASSNGYVAVEIDDEAHRLYFVTASSSEGYKLTSSSKNGTCMSITFTVEDIDEWKPYVGDYDLKKDVTDGTYYIDLPKLAR